LEEQWLETILKKNLAKDFWDGLGLK